MPAPYVPPHLWRNMMVTALRKEHPSLSEAEVQEFADDLLLRAEKIGAQLRERLGETS